MGIFPGKRESAVMPFFITQGRFTHEALRGMLAMPEGRGEAVAKLFAATGGKLLSCFMTFGDYDLLVVSEGPDEGMAALPSSPKPPAASRISRRRWRFPRTR